jgi:hypothetical protein
MIDPVEYFEQQLRVLEELLTQATPSDRVFLERTQTEVRSYLEEARAPKAPITPDGLRARLTRAYVLVAQLERELATPSLGEHWHRWALDELERTRERIARTAQELQLLEPEADVSPPPQPDATLVALQDELEWANLAVSEAEMMLGLHESWMERTPLSEDKLAIARVQLLDLQTRHQRTKDAARDLEVVLSKLV